MAKPSVFRIATFDIEATSLEASYGRVICCGFKFLDEDNPRMVVAKGLHGEAAALTAIGQLWDKADMVVSWNGLMYDVPFLNARRMRYGMAPLGKKLHTDLMWHHKKLRTRGHRLEGASIDLGCKSKKFNVPAEYWQYACDNKHPLAAKALADIVKHCEYDVVLTEEMFGKLKPLICGVQKR